MVDDVLGWSLSKDGQFLQLPADDLSVDLSSCFFSNSTFPKLTGYVGRASDLAPSEAGLFSLASGRLPQSAISYRPWQLTRYELC